MLDIVSMQSWKKPFHLVLNSWIIKKLEIIKKQWCLDIWMDRLYFSAHLQVVGNHLYLKWQWHCTSFLSFTREKICQLMRKILNEYVDLNWNTLLGILRTKTFIHVMILQGPIAYIMVKYLKKYFIVSSSFYYWVWRHKTNPLNTCKTMLKNVLSF